MTGLSPLVESLEMAGYKVQAGKVRDAMTPSVPKQKSGGHKSTGHPFPSSSSNYTDESPPPEPSTSKTEPSVAVQLRPLDLNQCVGEDRHGNPSFVLKMDELDGSQGTKKYTGKERISSWTYEGNGRNLDKAMSIIHSNSWKSFFYLSVTDSEIHSDTQEFPEIDSFKYLYITVNCNLNQESGEKISKICISLFTSLPNLRYLDLDGCGSVVAGIGEMYQYFRPNSITAWDTGVSFSDIILSSEDQQSISVALSGNITFTFLQLIPTDRTITSMTEFTRALAICRHKIYELAFEVLIFQLRTK